MNTGVSRSGRIRKKSSKLRDYQSPDDWEGQGAGAVTSANSTTGHSKQPILDPDEGMLDDESRIPTAEEGGGDAELSSVPRRSIYMSEKSSKSRVLMSDGSVQIKRQPRKDKGRTRMTAYMLWARSVRGQMEDLDFTAKSQRLGELWANVPTSERLLWKRRVTTHNKTMAKQAAKAAAATALADQAANNSKLQKKTKAATGVTPATGNQQARKQVRRETMAAAPLRSSAGPLECTDPINIAAHLKLLGDSLSNIGESLQQHEDKGQNSITGTVSVLLDSLLCSVVPLLSLTTHIEGFGHRVAHLKDTLQNTLDNIAYVMPGLPF